MVSCAWHPASGVVVRQVWYAAAHASLHTSGGGGGDANSSTSPAGGGGGAHSAYVSEPALHVPTPLSSTCAQKLKKPWLLLIALLHAASSSSYTSHPLVSVMPAASAHGSVSLPS